MDENEKEQLPASAAESDDLTLTGEWARALVDQTLAGIYVIQDGYFRYVNQEFANIFGYASPAELIDTIKIADLIAPEERQRVADNIRRRAEGLIPEMRYSFVGVQRNGRRVHVEVHGRAMQFKGQPAVIGVTLDITERKLAEAASNEKLSALFRHSPLGIALVDEAGRHRECNEAYQQLLGCTDEALTAVDMWSLIPEQFAGQAAEMRQALEVGGRYGAVELEYRRPDGRCVPVQTSGVRIAGSGEQHYVWSIVEDISERKRLEREMAEQLAALKKLNKQLQDTQTQLLHAEKMSAVGQLAAGVAHEINNPVGFVKSNLGTLQNYLSEFLRLVGAYETVLVDKPANDPLRRQIHDLEKAMDFAFIRDDAQTLLQESLTGIERVKRIVADLRDFSKPGDAEWQQADIHECLDSTLNIVANEIRPKAEVIRDYGTLPRIRCMPFQLNQVFMNLLLNAAQAIPEKGRIVVRSGHEDDHVWVEVEDSGTGIAPDILARVFEPFFTTKPIGKGTGLGLAVSYGIIKSHAGDISVRNKEDGGAIFRVTLPVEPQGATG
ncbi:MAG: PAS domain S-box protein [Gammaproteobacteria bacterium]|nr:PAS domain S-box protein [Gammaproteobacteria bacterium]MBU1600460.1 PAS domain S-box protein [Gammaproteobacteria bacterium]MBU2434916.1 PAS domain S-box protein [Gammaproteobacteria bacterium]MBU2448152.1 PAS domain S-box protein [Gammaproteobacteria bacterium]